MPELFDTSRVRDDAAHWDAAAVRVAEHVVHNADVDSMEWFAHSRVSWIAASLLLAAALVFMILPAGSAAAREFDREWQSALAPADDVGRSLLVHDGPPTIGLLLLPTPVRSTR